MATSKRRTPNKGKSKKPPMGKRQRRGGFGRDYPLGGAQF